jgi:hypothetical protein
VPDPLFPVLLREGFHRLDPIVRALHEAPGEWSGRCRVERGAGLLGAIAGRVMSLPPAGIHDPVRVRIERQGDGETWTRFIGGSRMRSRLRSHHGLLSESMGPATFRFALEADGALLRWRLRSVSSFGIALPLSLFAIDAREWSEGGRYRFHVSAAVAGRLLVAYDGALEP